MIFSWQWMLIERLCTHMSASSRHSWCSAGSAGCATSSRMPCCPFSSRVTSAVSFQRDEGLFFRQPTNFAFLPRKFRRISQNIRECSGYFCKHTGFQQLSLLFVRDVRKAPNRGLEGSLLPLTRRKSFQTLNEKHISCNACPKY